MIVPRLWLGIAQSAGYTITVVADSEKKAADQLYKQWRNLVYPGFEPQINSGELLLSEADAHITEITDKINGAFIWEQSE